MKVTCPDCGCQGHINAFLLEDECKRLLVVMAPLPPELSRALLAYLGLFKPAKHSLRMGHAIRIAQEVAELVAAGTVSKEECNGPRRPTQVRHWISGIDQVLAARSKLSLPLQSHVDLRAAVFGLADQPGIAPKQDPADRARSQPQPMTTTRINGGPVESRLEQQLAWINQRLSLGQMSEAEAQRERADAQAKYGEK
ncbi:hypothetical protein CR156_10505 [Stenotrophomonas lactitubi]|uniref:hypothetical protein n=1 Tax=Stenotrophomonas lactitubi TaxID=2045214 RepID=UPI000C27BEB4|nr:hypothetical protein [Stenotrophomonas lactitubi]PJO52587.1 hypothetical protein CR156_10505 [Stenotrophomonas lactitubi]